MARTSRFVTEFDVEGRTWEALFIHKHAQTVDGKVQPIMHQPDITKPAIGVLHVTVCKLRHKGSPIFLQGTAPCSLNDTYNWRRGLHYSLQRALERAGYCKLVKIGSSADCPHTPHHYDTKGGCPDVGRIAVASKKPIYTEIMASFWQEMRIRPMKSTHGVVECKGHPLPVVGTVGRTPLVHQHGLGYTGAD